MEGLEVDKGGGDREAGGSVEYSNRSKTGAASSQTDSNYTPTPESVEN